MMTHKYCTDPERVDNVVAALYGMTPTAAEGRYDDVVDGARSRSSPSASKNLNS